MSINGKGYQIMESTAAEVAKCIDSLPTVQTVRGSVWGEETARALIADIRAGNYVPPIVFAGQGEEASCVDGQQRSRAIAKALKSGALDGTEPVLVAVDNVRSTEEAFYRLNVGVPVGASLIAAMDAGDAGKAVIQIASNAYFDGVAWSANQAKKTMRGDFAAAMLAILAGWDSPESSNKACNAWIKSHGDAVTDEVVKAAEEMLSAIGEAVKPLIKEAAITGKAGKAARSTLGKLRRKNLWMTLVGGMADGLSPVDIIKVYRHEELLKPTPYEVRARNGRVVSKTANWSLGAGSSGSYDEYRDRLIVLRAACAGLGEVLMPDNSPAEDKAADDVAQQAPAGLASALGVAING